MDTLILYYICFMDTIIKKQGKLDVELRVIVTLDAEAEEWIGEDHHWLEAGYCQGYSFCFGW